MVKVVLSIPTWITLLRVALIPLFVALLIDPSEQMLHWAVYIFVFAAITDYLDGFVARALGSVSDFGKLLDPLADKILVLSALTMLTALKTDQYGEPWVPGWMVVLVIARDVWITGLRGVAAEHGSIVAAKGLAKVKSFLQMVSVIFLLLHDMIIHFGFIHISCQMIGLNLLFISLMFSYWSALQYSVMIFGSHGDELPASSPPAQSGTEPQASIVDAE